MPHQVRHDSTERTTVNKQLVSWKLIWTFEKVEEINKEFNQ